MIAEGLTDLRRFVSDVENRRPPLAPPRRLSKSIIELLFNMKFDCQKSHISRTSHSIYIIGATCLAPPPAPIYSVISCPYVDA